MRCPSCSLRQLPPPVNIPVDPEEMLLGLFVKSVEVCIRACRDKFVGFEPGIEKGHGKLHLAPADLAGCLSGAGHGKGLPGELVFFLRVGALFLPRPIVPRLGQASVSVW